MTLTATGVCTVLLISFKRFYSDCLVASGWLRWILLRKSLSKHWSNCCTDSIGVWLALVVNIFHRAKKQYQISSEDLFIMVGHSIFCAFGLPKNSVLSASSICTMSQTISKAAPISQGPNQQYCTLETADLLTFTEKIHSRKTYFLCSGSHSRLLVKIFPSSSSTFVNWVKWGLIN